MRSRSLDSARGVVRAVLQSGKWLDAEGARSVIPSASIQWARDTLKDLASARLAHVAEFRPNRRGRPTPVYAWGEKQSREVA